MDDELAEKALEEAQMKNTMENPALQKSDIRSSEQCKQELMQVPSQPNIMDLPLFESPNSVRYKKTFFNTNNSSTKKLNADINQT